MCLDENLMSSGLEKYQESIGFYHEVSYNFMYLSR